MFPALRRPLLRRTSAPTTTVRDFTDWLDPLERRWMEPLSEPEFPSVDIKETDKEVIAKAELPGMKPEDIDVSIRDSHLVLQGEKKHEEESGEGEYRFFERRYGSFSRLLPLPSEVDKDNVKAKYTDGVLEVRVPKSAQSASKKVEIES
mgnify:CR=1 FL=1